MMLWIAAFFAGVCAGAVLVVMLLIVAESDR
jgi:hypothetical protein